MNRRKVLLGSGAVLSTSLAGCSNVTDSVSDTNSENGDEVSSTGNGETNAHPEDNGNDPDSEEPIDPIEFEQIAAQDDRWPTDETELLSLENTLDSDEPLYDLKVATGDSSEVTEELSFGDGFLVIVFEHDGDRFTLDLEGETEKRVISESDTAEGMEIVRIPAGEIPPGEYVANVEADGNWKIIVSQPSTAATVVRTPPFEASGDGVDIIGPMKSVTVEEVITALEHDEEALAITAHHEDPKTDVKWMEIEVDGEWRIEADS